MAKANESQADELAMASVSALEGWEKDIGKHLATIKNRLTRQADRIDQLNDQVNDLKAAHAKEMAETRAEWTRETDSLKRDVDAQRNEVASLKDKLRRVQATLA